MNLRKLIEAALQEFGAWTGYSISLERVRIYLPILKDEERLRAMLPPLDIPVEIRQAPLFALPKPRQIAPANIPLDNAPAELKAADRLIARSANGPGRPGCIGAFVEAESESGTWVLTANHVAAGNGSILPFGPDPNHGIFAGPSFTRVGKAVAHSLITETQNQGLDAAVCRVENPNVQLRPRLHVRMQGLVAEFHPPVEEAEVVFQTPEGQIKVARIVDASSVLQVRMGSLGLVTFPNHILIAANQPIIDGGESGSMVAQRDNGSLQPIGIIVGFPEGGTGAHRHAVVCPLTAIFADPAIKQAVGEVDKILVP